MSSNVCLVKYIIKITDNEGVGAPSTVLAGMNQGVLVGKNGNIYYYSVQWTVDEGTTVLAVSTTGGSAQLFNILTFNCVKITQLVNRNTDTTFKSTINSDLWVALVDFNLTKRLYPGSLVVTSSQPVSCPKYEIFQLNYMYIYCTFNFLNPLYQESVTLSFTYLSTLVSTLSYTFPIPIQTVDPSPSVLTFQNPIQNTFIPQLQAYEQITMQINSYPTLFRTVCQNTINSHFWPISMNPLTIFSICTYSPSTPNLGYFYFKLQSFITSNSNLSQTTIQGNTIGTTVFITSPPIFEKTMTVSGIQTSIMYKTNSTYSFKFQDLESQFNAEFPIGFLSGRPQYNNYKLNFIFSPFISSVLFISITANIEQPTQFDTEKPIITNINYIPLNNLNILVQVSATDNLSGVFIIECEYFNLKYSDLANGTFLNGTFEKIIQLSYDSYFNLPVNTFKICDFAGNCAQQIINDYWNGWGPLPQLPNLILPFTAPDIDNFSFSTNNIVLNGTQGIDLTLIVKFKQSSYNTRFMSLFFSPLYDTILHPSDVVRGIYQPSIYSYKFDISIPGGLVSGILQYSITFPLITLSNLELEGIIGGKSVVSISNVGVSDRMPPYVSKSVQVYTTDPDALILGWNLTIIDGVCGLKRGYMMINNYYGFEPYILEIQPHSDIYNSTYSLVINVNSQGCLNGDSYFISYLELEDNCGSKSIYNSSQNLDSYVNPFYLTPSMVPIVCLGSYPQTTSSATLISFIKNTNLIDVGLDNRNLSISFTVQSSDPFDLTRHIPYCLLMGVNGDSHKFRAKKPTNPPSLSQTFICETNVPIGFGYFNENSTVLISIYGVTTGNFGYKGFTTNSIIDIGENPFLKVTYSQYIPIITSASQIPLNSSVPSSLTLYGKKFNPYSSISLYGYALVVSPIFISPSIMIINGLANIPGPSLGVQITSPYISNNFTIQLTISDSSEQSSSMDSSSSSSDIINLKCPGSPECGGSSNGDCINSVCVCKNNWRGEACLSRTVINEPIINSTNPSVTNNYTSTSPDGKQVQLKSLISIISVQEYNFKDQLIKNYPLTSWNFTNITTIENSIEFEEYLYQTSFNSNKTNIGVNIKWYKTKKIISFANESLTMYPSTLKYQVELTPYEFGSNLNHLEVIFSTSFQELDNDNSQKSCSYQESGNTSENSDFIRLQLNTHSLYGRFIKRAIIDNRKEIISNKFNNQESSTSLVSSSISIMVPYYSTNVLLDPDFSLLLDSSPANDKEGSVCSKLDSNSKLTRNQLIGIIVGASIFGLIGIGLLTYVILRKSKNVTAIKLSMKLRAIGRRNI